MAITVTTDVTTVQAIFDQLARFPLRAELHFEDIATVRKTDGGPRRGSSVKFPLWTDPAAQITALTENADVTAVTLGDSTVTVTLVEQGAAFGATKKLILSSYIDVLKDMANMTGYNAGISLDGIARAVVFGGSNVRFVGQATQGAITASNTLTAAETSRQVAALRGANVKEIDGKYVGYIHPDVSHDFRIETGEASWVVPANRQEGGGRRWNGMIGTFNGVRWIEASRAVVTADAGATATVDVYATVIVGAEALAKATSDSETPDFIVSPVVDKLKRFIHFGWYQYVGYGRYREAAIRRIESASSIAVNV